MKYNVVALEYDTGAHYDVTLGPLLARIKPGKPDILYWYLSGPTYYSAGKDHYRILKHYGLISSDDWDKLDKIDIQFAKDFPPERGLRDSPGWLSPEGDYWPCRSLAHRSNAEQLVRLIYSEIPSNAELALEKKGWLKLYGNLVCHPQHGNEVTQAQLTALAQLMEIASDELRTAIKEAVRYFLGD